MIVVVLLATTVNNNNGSEKDIVNNDNTHNPKSLNPETQICIRMITAGCGLEA